MAVVKFDRRRVIAFAWLVSIVSGVALLILVNQAQLDAPATTSTTAGRPTTSRDAPTTTAAPATSTTSAVATTSTTTPVTTPNGPTWTPWTDPAPTTTTRPTTTTAPPVVTVTTVQPTTTETPPSTTTTVTADPTVTLGALCDLEGATARTHTGHDVQCARGAAGNLRWRLNRSPDTPPGGDP